MPAADRQLRLLVRHSAAEKDVALAEELLGHLRPLERFVGLDVWSEARIRAGDDARQEIQRAIDQANVALLLLSVDFFASDRLVEIEVPRFMERHRAGELRVIPVLLRPCLWDVHPWLKELQPLPRGEKPIAAFSGEARDAVLTELAREIPGLAVTSAPEGATPHARQTAGATPAAAAVKGNSTFYVNIQNSTLGSAAFGDGTAANGRAAVLRQVVEEEPTPGAAMRPDRSSPLPLVVLGPHVIAEGERVAVAGNVWTVRLYRFLHGDASALSQVSDASGSTPLGDRFIVLSEPGEARTLVGDLAWHAEGDDIDVHVPVAPPPAKQPVTEVEDLDIETFQEVRGVKAGVSCIKSWLGTAVGMLELGVGCWIPNWLENDDLRPRLHELVKVELLRLSSVPRIDSYSAEVYIPLGFVERVLAARPRMDEADANTIPVDIELVFVRGGRWKGEVRVARQKAEAYDKVLKEFLAQARRL